MKGAYWRCKKNIFFPLLIVFLAPTKEKDQKRAWKSLKLEAREAMACKGYSWRTQFQLLFLFTIMYSLHNEAFIFLSDAKQYLCWRFRFLWSRVLKQVLMNIINIISSIVIQIKIMTVAPFIMPTLPRHDLKASLWKTVLNFNLT